MYSPLPHLPLFALTTHSFVHLHLQLQLPQLEIQFCSQAEVSIGLSALPHAVHKHTHSLLYTHTHLCGDGELTPLLTGQGSLLASQGELIMMMRELSAWHKFKLQIRHIKAATGGSSHSLSRDR